MTIVTRLNPTISGGLHIGHLYLALVNAYEAHRAGGRFIVRFDDAQPYWVKRLGMDTIEAHRAQMIYDLSAYVKVDRWIDESACDHNVLEHYKTVVVPTPPEQATSAPSWFPQVNSTDKYDYADVPEWIPDRTEALYPYAPDLTAETVYLDWCHGINWLIMGEDLVSRASLYAYYRQSLGLAPMRQTFLPRLKTSHGQLSPISKAAGGFSIREMTEKYGVLEVFQILADACLINPDGAFEVANVKSEARLTMEDL